MARFSDLMRALEMAYQDVYKITPTNDRSVRVDQRIISQFGGISVDIPSRPSLFVLGDRFDLSGGARAVMERYNVSAATAYRWTKKK